MGLGAWLALSSSLVEEGLLLMMVLIQVCRSCFCTSVVALSLHCSQGPSYAAVCACFALLLELMRSIEKRSRSGFAVGVLYVMLARFAFFAFGHTCDFSTLHFDAGFIGVDEGRRFFALIEADHSGTALPVVSGVLVAFNALSPFVVVAATVRNMWIARIFALDDLLTAVFVFFARRHLMVWRVFAPKYVYDTVVSICIFCSSATLRMQ
jgi:hypothetical protein